MSLIYLECKRQVHTIGRKLKLLPESELLVSRKMYINQGLPTFAFDRKSKIKKEFKFPSNQVITAKYTIYNFVIKNLWEQYHRIANIFFTVIVVLQFFPQFSTISPGLAMLPLLIVLALTMIKDGIEDFRRHNSDRSTNQARCVVLSGSSWQNMNHTQSPWKGIFTVFDSMLHPRKYKNGIRLLDINQHDRENSKSEEQLQWNNIEWEELKVGDIILLRDQDAAPADFVVLASSEKDKACYVETKSLDGETNLKVRQSIKEMPMIQPESLQNLVNITMEIEAQARDTDMYKFEANMILTEITQKHASITINEMVLRGSSLRNTDWIIGCVIMTGKDTKVIANTGKSIYKRGSVEVEMVPMVYFTLITLAVMCACISIADSLLEKHFFQLDAYWEYLAIFNDDNPQVNGLISFANSLITLQNILPISLYISIEFVRTAQAYFISSDSQLYDEKKGKKCIPKSWNLADELGRVEYIFSDKTGTLTENKMIFRAASLGDQKYIGEIDREENEIQDEENKRSENVNFRSTLLQEKFSLAENISIRSHLGLYWRAIVLCHSVSAVESEEEGGKVIYKAQSPDERALIQAAADIGFTLLQTDQGTIKIRTPLPSEERFQILQTLSFTSTRKRMSVIVESSIDGSIFLFTKGADNVILERMQSGQDELAQKINNDLESFANKGLRTLCLAYKEIPKQTYEQWKKQYHESSISLTAREENLELLASEMETELKLLGCSAIEDRLQEDVPDTIRDLRKAGIKVWVVTGDKLETAIAIGYSSLLLSSEMDVAVIKGSSHASVQEQLHSSVITFFGGLENLERLSKPYLRAKKRQLDFFSIRKIHSQFQEIQIALVLDGDALEEILEDEDNLEIFIKLSTQCTSVLCCRLSPLQKAKIVNLIRLKLGSHTLAIGDGANDVSMIKAAHVGVGISGEEGMQAVNNSDFVISQFKYLKRLILVHGHWCFHRNGSMIINFFYKNYINTFTLFLFQFYCAWSSTQGMDYVYILFWNSIWTSAAVIVLGIFDQILPDHTLIRVPQLYRYSQKGYYFGPLLFLLYVFDALWQSVVMFFIIDYTYRVTTVRLDGYTDSLWEWTTTLVMTNVFCANLTTGLDIRSWNWWIVAGVWIGPLLIFLFAPIYAAFPPSLLWTYSWSNNHSLYYSFAYWGSGILTIVLALLPRFIWNYIQFNYFPTSIDLFRADIRSRKQKETKLESHNMETISRQPSLHRAESNRSSIHHNMAEGSTNPHRGFSFSIEEGSLLGSKSEQASRRKARVNIISKPIRIGTRFLHRK